MALQKIRQNKPYLFAAKSVLIAGCIFGAAKSLATDVIDVMVLYTSGAESDRNGAIDTYINYLIAAANTAYQDSEMDIQLRLVHSQKMDIDGTEEVDGSGLSILQQDADVAALRSQYGADLVSLLNLSQHVNGGYICGIAYLGAGSDGEFNRYAKNSAFSLVGADCGATTFSHELGHNMGLGHSRLQEDLGGVYDFGLGYGVQNSFATIMTYEYLFNAPGVERFSNPNIKDCDNQACGVDRTSAVGADAAYAVNQVSSQLADFYPTQVAVTTGSGAESGSGDNQTDDSSSDNSQAGSGSSDGGDSTDDSSTASNGADPIVAVPEIANNLIDNASFESGYSPWFSLFNAEVGIDTLKRATGEQSLLVSNREAYYSGAGYALDGQLQDGHTYKISARMKLDGDGSESGRMVIGLNDDRGMQYTYFDRVGINADQWSTIDGEFTLSVEGDIKTLFILFYGPAADKNFYLDQVSIVSSDEVVDQTSEPLSDNLIDNGDFELATSAYWQTGFYGRVGLTTTANNGSYALLSSKRRRWYDGPMQLVTGEVESETSYHLSASVRMLSGEDEIEARLYYRDDSGHHWLSIDSLNADQTWRSLDGDIYFSADGEIQQARLHFFGPARGASFMVDDVVLSKR